MQKRYALANDKDSDAGLIWSVGGVWSSKVPEVEKLLTGPEVDAFSLRHAGAVVVDVIVYLEMCKVYREAFNASLVGVERSTHEDRMRAREAGRQALIRSGYTLAASKNNPFNPCEF